MERAIETFIDDVRDILASDGAGDRGMDLMVERMGALVRDPDVLAEVGRKRSSFNVRENAMTMEEAA